MKLLVLAAGIGSRFGGVKQTAGVGPAGETILEYSVFDALCAGFDDVVFLIRAGIEDDFRLRVLSRLPEGLRFRLAFQEIDSLLTQADRAVLAASGRSKPWGTGHALLCARSSVGEEPFAVINADDYYGRNAFALVHDFLAGERGGEPGGMPGQSPERKPAVPRFCMVGYLMDRVVPPQGSVSRAVCAVDSDGVLGGIREHVRIERESEGIVSTLPDGTRQVFAGDELVSMNIWGLGPEVFDSAERQFRGFMDVHGGSASAEFYLPAIVGEMADSGEAEVHVLPCGDRLFGITNSNDIAAARRAFEGMAADGLYPVPLWDGWRNPS